MKTLITIHASGTTADAKSVVQAGKPFGMLDVDRRDRENGFARIGYHFVIERDGHILVGRKENEASVHDDVKRAREAISVCLIGGASESGAAVNNFTDEQTDALRFLIQDVVKRYEWKADLFGKFPIVSVTAAVSTDEVERWLK